MVLGSQALDSTLATLRRRVADFATKTELRRLRGLPTCRINPSRPAALRPAFGSRRNSRDADHETLWRGKQDARLPPRRMREGLRVGTGDPPPASSRSAGPRAAGRSHRPTTSASASTAAYSRSATWRATRYTATLGTSSTRASAKSSPGKQLALLLQARTRYRAIAPGEDRWSVRLRTTLVRDRPPPHMRVSS